MSRSVSSYAKIRTFLERGSSNPSIRIFEIIDRAWTKNFQSVDEYRDGPLADYAFARFIVKLIARWFTYHLLSLYFFFFLFFLSRDNLRIKRTPNLSSKRQRNSRLHFIVGQTPAINDNSSMTRSQNRKENNSWNTSCDRHTILTETRAPLPAAGCQKENQIERKHR